MGVELRDTDSRHQVRNFSGTSSIKGGWLSLSAKVLPGEMLSDLSVMFELDCLEPDPVLALRTSLATRAPEAAAGIRGLPVAVTE